MSTYNKFRSANLKDGCYVYALTHGKNIIYVGNTGYLTARYKQHFKEQYIREMRAKGEYPGLIILGVFNTQAEAEAAEHSLIRCLSWMNNRLINYHQNPKTNEIICPYKAIPNLKRMPTTLFKSILQQAIQEYNTFTQWEPTKL